MVKLGAHMSIAGGVDQAIARGVRVQRAAHCTLFAIQILGQIMWCCRQFSVGNDTAHN